MRRKYIYSESLKEGIVQKQKKMAGELGFSAIKLQNPIEMLEGAAITKKGEE